MMSDCIIIHVSSVREDNILLMPSPHSLQINGKITKILTKKITKILFVCLLASASL